MNAFVLHLQNPYSPYVLHSLVLLPSHILTRGIEDLYTQGLRHSIQYIT